MPSPVTDPSVRALWSRLSVSLSFVTGMVDIMGWLVLAKFFTANITGDFIISLSGLVTRVPPTALQVLAIPFYLGGAVVAYLVAHALGVGGTRMLRTQLAAEVLLLAGALVLSTAGPRPMPATSAYAVAIGLCVVTAIGLQNASMKLADPAAPTTWAITANTMTALIAGLDAAFSRGADRSAARHALWATLPAVLAFLVGALAGTLATTALDEWSWAVPLGVVVVLLGSLRQRTGAAQRRISEAAPSAA